MAVVYSIRDWNDHFEVAQSRKLKKAMDWVALPTKHDGKSFRRIMLMEDGPAIYGVWVLLVQIAAKCPRRGVLADADGPLDTTDFAIKTGCRQELFDKALNVLADKKIGWLLVGEWESSGSSLPPQTLPDSTDPTHPPTKPGIAAASNGSGHQAGGRAGGDFGFSLGWEVIERELGALKVSRWKDAIRDAKAAGCTARHALEIIDYGKANGYQAGGIFRRLSNANPSMPVESNWPTQPPAAVRAASAEQEKLNRQLELHRLSEAEKIIKAGQRAGKSDDEIRADLAAQNLEHHYG